MAISSKNVKLAMDFESSFGTVKGTPTLHYFSFVDEQLDISQGLIKNESVRQSFSALKPVYGPSDAGGSLSHYPTIETAPWFQKWLLGTLVETGTTPNYVLTSKDGTAVAPSAVAEKELVGLSEFKKHLGLTVDTFDLEFDATGYLKFTVGTVGKVGSVEASTLDASIDDWTTGDPLNHLQISAITLGGVATTVIKKGKISVKRNIYRDDYRAGQGATRQSAVCGMYDITGTLDFCVDDATTLTNLAAGIADSAIKLTWTEAANRYFSVEVPNIIVQKRLPTGASPILMVEGAQFSAYYKAASAASIVMETGTSYQATKYA